MRRAEVHLVNEEVRRTDKAKYIPMTSTNTAKNVEWSGRTDKGRPMQPV